LPLPRTLVTRRLPSKVLARLEERSEVDLHDGDGLTRDELRARVAGKQAMICVLTDRVDAAVIDAGGELKVIADVAVGYDNIDVAHARSRGVVVTNTPDVLTEAVAEFTWGLILSVTRRITEGDRLVRAGGWKRWALDFMLGAELGGKQLGIIGMGRIGRAVAARAPSFGMSVVYHGGRGSEAGGQGPGAGGGQPRPVSFDELLVTSDVISIHTPLKSETRHLIDQRALARMKRRSYLINTSRGPVVERRWPGRCASG
jgi:glyoxylate reductase